MIICTALNLKASLMGSDTAADTTGHTLDLPVPQVLVVG